MSFEIQRHDEHRAVPQHRAAAAMFRGGLCLALFALLWSSVAQAQLTVSEVSLRKQEITHDGGLPPGPLKPFAFEGCIQAAGVMTTGNFLRITLAAGGSGGSHELAPLGGGLFCVLDGFDSEGLLGAAFPSAGDTYQFDMRPAAGGSNIEYDFVFNAVAPATALTIGRPGSLDPVLADRDLVVTWTYASPPCGNCPGVLIDFDDFASAPFEGEADASDTSFPIPSSNLSVTTDYLLSVGGYNGTLNVSDSQNGSTFDVDRIWEKLDRTMPSAVARTLDLQEVELTKGVERIDGSPIAGDAYFFEACVVGPGIISATLEIPDMTDRTMNLVAADTRCFLEEFSTQIALDTAYPSMAGDNYEFRFSQADLAQVFLPGEFDAPAPLASIDYVNPTDNATVPEDQNLNVAWLFDKGTSNCSRPGDCGDGIVSLLEDTLSDDILAASPPLAIEATGYTFPSAALTAGKQVDVVSAIYTGVVSDQLTDGISDMYTLTAANTDVNEITINVPEPSSMLLAGFALTAAIGLGRWRREA